MIIQTFECVFTITFVYILYRIGYRLTTGHHSNPVAKTDPLVDGANQHVPLVEIEH